VKVVANCFEKLTANSVVDRELRIKLQCPVERNSTRRSEASIWRAQNQLINRDQPRAQVIFCIRLLQLKLLQFLDLQNLAEQHEQSVALDSAVPQENFAFSNNRVR